VLWIHHAFSVAASVCTCYTSRINCTLLLIFTR
jgi:hypothetical protein